MLDKSSTNSVSDIGVASEIALSGVRGGCMNVLINLKGIDDKKYLKKVKSAVKTLIQRAELLHQKVFIKTMKIIDD